MPLVSLYHMPIVPYIPYISMIFDAQLSNFFQYSYTASLSLLTSTISSAPHMFRFTDDFISLMSDMLRPAEKPSQWRSSEKGQT